MDTLIKQLNKYWNKDQGCFIVQKKDKFWLDLLLARAYNEIQKNPENAKHFTFLEFK